MAAAALADANLAGEGEAGGAVGGRGDQDAATPAADLLRAKHRGSKPGGMRRIGAELAGGFNAKTFRLWRAFSSAAADDPAVDQEFSELSAFIRGQCRQIVAMLADRGWLRDDVAVDELGDSLWVLVGS